MKTLQFIPLLLLLLNPGTGVYGDAYNINFYWSNDSKGQVNELPGDGFAGVINLENWNDVDEVNVANFNPTNRSLLQPITVQFSGIGTEPNAPIAEPPQVNGDNEQLMYRGLRSGNAGNALTASVSGLPQEFIDNGFEVYAYFTNTEGNNYNGTYKADVDDEVSAYGVVAPSFSDPADDGSGFSNAGQSSTAASAGLVNYIHLESISGRDNFTFTLSNEDVNQRVILQGLQIIVIPEAGSLMLVLIAGSGAFALLRRRR